MEGIGRKQQQKINEVNKVINLDTHNNDERIAMEYEQAGRRFAQDVVGRKLVNREEFEAIAELSPTRKEGSSRLMAAVAGC